jgi:hypothetical protein
MIEYLGVKLPTSVRVLNGHRTWRYQVAPAWPDSYGVATAPDWPTPTALEFEVKTLHAEKLGAVGTLMDEPVPPDALLYLVEATLRMSVAQIADLLRAGDKVLDTEGLRSEITPGEFRTTGIRTTGIAWPAVPGVTVRYEDSTR